jgi:hypothetical protein
VRQLGFVVHDLDRALEYWTKTLGVGPFFTIRNVVPEKWRYRGQPSPASRASVALANSGDLQIEIIQQHDDHPTGWRDFFISGRKGFQHVSSGLTREEYDAAMARMLDATTRKLYDNLDRQRALQAYLLDLPVVNQAANRNNILKMGPANKTVPIWENLVDYKTAELTANDNTPYT